MAFLISYYILKRLFGRVRACAEIYIVPLGPKIQVFYPIRHGPLDSNICLRDAPTYVYIQLFI